MFTVLLSLLACSGLDGFVGGLTNPNIAASLVAGVDAPADLDLSGTPYDGGAQAGVYLASLDGSVSDDAQLTLESPSNGTLAFTSDGDGAWSTDAALDYVPGDTYVIARDGTEILRADAAAEADVTMPTTQPLGAALTLDASGQGFDALLVAVVNVATKEVAWTNAPDDASALYDMLVAEPVLALDVPGTAFGTAGTYAVGVAGLMANTPAEVTDVNKLASLMGTGVVTFRKVVVEDEATGT